MPKVDLSTYAQLLNIIIFYAAVLLLHFLLFKLFAAWSWLRKRGLPGFLVFPYPVRVGPEPAVAVFALPNLPYEARASLWHPPTQPHGLAWAWGHARACSSHAPLFLSPLPDVLLPSHPCPPQEIYVVTFFLVSASSAVGVLLASAIVFHRAVSAAIGSVALFLLLAFMGVACFVVYRICTSLKVLGLRYVAQTPPAEDGAREGRLARWLRTTQVKGWEYTYFQRHWFRGPFDTYS